MSIDAIKHLGLNLETDGSAKDDKPAAKKQKNPWVHYEVMMFMKEDIVILSEVILLA
jgi:hypothetical protein